MKKLLNKIILENGLGKIDTFNSLADTIENSLFESDFKSLTSALRMFIEGVLREYKKEHQENLKPSTVQKLFLDEYIRLGILAKGFEKTNDLLDVLNSPQHFKNFTGFFNFTMERAEDVLIKFVKSINELFNTHYKIPHVEYRDQAEEGFKKVSTSIVSFQNVKNWKMIIPQFQRDYVWGVDKIRELLMGEEDFIGNIVVSYKNGKYHVIDGQQRILTLLSALKINDKENKFDIKAEYGRSDVIDFVSGNKNKKPFYDIDIDINKLDKKYFNLLLVPYEESYKYFEIMNISGHELTPAEKATALMITSLKNVSSSVKNGLRSLIIEDRNFTDEMLKEFRVDISEGDINKLLEANFVHKMFLGTLEHKIGKKNVWPSIVSYPQKEWGELIGSNIFSWNRYMSEDLEPVIEKNFKISYDGKLNIKILDIDELKSYFFNYLKILIVDILIESLKIEYHYHGSNKEYVMDVLENNPWIKEIDINNEWENILRNYLNNKDYITFFRRTFGLETITPREDWKKLKKYQVDYIPEDWSKVDNYRELSTMMYFIDSPEYKVKNSTIIVRTQDEFIELFKSTVVMNDRQQLRKDILIKKYEEGYDISLFDDVEKNIEYLLEDTLKKLKNKKIDIFDFE